MTGFTNDVIYYNNWFADNYHGLQKYCKRYRINEDILNDVYINVRERILRSGFTESYYTTYVKRSIRNLKINEEKKCNGRHFVDCDSEDYTNTVENKLQNIDETDRDTQQYREEIMYLSKKIFEYLQTQRYDDNWNFVFRCYYLMPNRFTYSKLHAMTGINKNACTKIIQTMKKDIRINFLIWLNSDNRRIN
jgi:hypothetical protein